MDYVVIDGVPPYDGRWEFDMEKEMLDTHALGWIRRVTGFYPVEIPDALSKGDAELITMLAVCALVRAGEVPGNLNDVRQVYDRIASLPFGDVVSMDNDDDDEGDAGPPSSSSSVNGASSGAGSTTSSETSAPTLQPSGMPASGSSVSGPPTLAP